jgi:hypothetical protein
MKLTTRFKLLMRLRMHGAIPTFPKYIIMACYLIKQEYIFMVWYIARHMDNFTQPCFTYFTECNYNMSIFH